MKQNGKTATRPSNRQLKAEFEKGFEAGRKACKAESKDLVDAVRKILGKHVSQQLVDFVDAGIRVEMTISTTGEEVLDILRKAI